MITPLTAEHLPLYADVIRDSFATVAAELKLTPKNCRYHPAFVTNERLAEKIGDGYYPFGYFADGELVGFVSLTDEGGGVFEMNDVAVLPEFRRSGAGKALVDFCKMKVAGFGGKKIVIEVVNECAGLKEWYAAQGFAYTHTKKYEHLTITFGYMEWEVPHEI